MFLGRLRLFSLRHFVGGILAVGVVGCTRPAPSPGPEIEVHVQPQSLQAPLASHLRQAWNAALHREKERVSASESTVHLRVWSEGVEQDTVLYLGVVWPQGWLSPPPVRPLPSPVKLGMALSGEAPGLARYQDASDELLELFWVQVQLAQSAWPISPALLDDARSIPVRSMTADWLGRHGKPHPELARGCLALLAHALGQPRRPQLDRLESSAACLTRVADASVVPEILDLMPNGHLRVEMLRVELLGALGGEVAADHLRWVQAQAQEPALARAATVALDALSR